MSLGFEKLLDMETCDFLVLQNSLLSKGLGLLFGCLTLLLDSQEPTRNYFHIFKSYVLGGGGRGAWSFACSSWRGRGLLILLLREEEEKLSRLEAFVC